MRYVFYYLLPIFFGVIGTAMLVNLLDEVGIDTEPIAQIVIWVLIGFFVLFLVYWYGIKRRRFEFIQIDERVRAITDKSARNGFIATWLGMLIFVDFGAPDTSSLLVAVAAGLVVYIVSGFIYNFKSG